MPAYPEIRQALFLFSVQVGLTDDFAREILERSLQNSEARRKFEEEVSKAFSDATTSWEKLLFNDEYEVYEAETKEQAREMAAEMLWEVVFPDTPLPDLA